jgi:hypothetical protein
MFLTAQASIDISVWRAFQQLIWVDYKRREYITKQHNNRLGQNLKNALGLCLGYIKMEYTFPRLFL